MILSNLIIKQLSVLVAIMVRSHNNQLLSFSEKREGKCPLCTSLHGYTPGQYRSFSVSE